MTNVTAILPADPTAITPVHQVVHRDQYGAITNAPRAVNLLAARVLDAINFVESFTHTNKRGGYEARSYEVYGYDLEREIVALKLSVTSRRKEGGWVQRQKTYLIGGLDEGLLYSHALHVPFRRIHDLHDATPSDVVSWAECKIFSVPPSRLHTINRLGDVALVPVRAIPGAAIKVDGARSLTLSESHKVSFDGQIYHDSYVERWFVNGSVRIDHDVQHRSIDAKGRFEIVWGSRRDLVFSTPD